MRPATVPARDLSLTPDERSVATLVGAVVFSATLLLTLAVAFPAVVQAALGVVATVAFLVLLAGLTLLGLRVARVV